MTDTLYLSRARLRTSRGEALAAIAPLLIPKDGGARAGHAHRILWLLFQQDPNAQRDFLWREDSHGRYLVLSRRPPSDPGALFELETKPFTPALAPGDRLAFALRVNPVIASKQALGDEAKGRRVRGKRVDIVMHELHAVAKGARAEARTRIAQEAAARWLAAQGVKAGFKLPKVPSVEGYRQISIARGQDRSAGIAVLDLKGEVEITEPNAFLAKLAVGFGSAKAFGNGLMLIRRA